MEWIRRKYFYNIRHIRKAVAALETNYRVDILTFILNYTKRNKMPPTKLNIKHALLVTDETVNGVMDVLTAEGLVKEVQALKKGHENDTMITFVPTKVYYPTKLAYAIADLLGVNIPEGTKLILPP